MPGWLNGLLGWLNVDRAGVIVALAAAVAAIIYAHRQTGVAKEATKVAKEAKVEAKRSADAAEKQAQIAEAAKIEAQRAADAAEDSASTARDAARIESRRDHQAGANKDVELVRVEPRKHGRLPHRELWAVFKNNGHRVYRYQVRVEYNARSHSPIGTGRIHAGETVSVCLGRERLEYSGIEVWFDGECPCTEPDGPDGHWRRFWPAPEPEEPPSAMFYTF
ncbi:hypothetical protein [Micromonospora okii]|uniref:hypothetical protein n=1 Tax=Micromonospora okii TaxID=1182970 RepID=UPI001E546A28|nr:hypothetical protein [Micromonospora okii]